MTDTTFIEKLDFDRAKSVHDISNTSCDETNVLLQAKDFGVDLVYFNKDERTNSMFPAVFFKRVTNFQDTSILEEIANIQRKVWNYKKVLFLYVYSDTEIRIYSCSEKPPIVTKDNFDYEKELQTVEIKSYLYSDKEQLKELNKLFSRIAIDTGIIWTLEEAQFIRDKISLQKRVDKYLVRSLINTANQLQEQGLKMDFIHKIILRSLFLLYLEDRGATDAKLYSLYKKDATSYFDILEDVDATYKLYERLENDFNGSIFSVEQNEKITVEQLQLIKKCFTTGNDKTAQTELFEDWRLFDFSIIQIELLSEIYENFLFDTDPVLKQQTGTFYTPPSLVEFILNEKLPVNNGEGDYNVKILDPSCGSGIFLVQIFKRLVKRYENKHNVKLTDFETLKNLLVNNIFGIELHPQSIKVAAFSLYLALVDNLEPKTLWQERKHRLPYLINNPDDKSLKEQGRNLFCRDTISDLSAIEELKNFHLVVGNPPFGRLLSEKKDKRNKHKNLREYCNKLHFANEMALPFLHKATVFAPKGEIALIFNTKILTNTGDTYQNFRQWLFEKECYVEKIYNFSILRKAPKDFGGQLFGEAVGPISIIFYQKEKPKTISDTFVYYAPKTYVKSNVLDGLSIDFTDVKYLPREECEKPNTKIWKIAMWGGMNDWMLINNISKNFTESIGDYLHKNNNRYSFGSGLHAPSTEQLDKKQVFLPDKVLDISQIQRYYTLESASNPSEKIYRNINKNIFIPPYIIIKEGQKDKEFCASYIDYKSYHAAYSISSMGKEDFNLKLWCSLINSTFAKYYLSLTSASWGIERERVQSNETLTLPMVKDVQEEIKLKLTSAFDELITVIRSAFDYVKSKQIENRIDDIIINEVLQLSEIEKTIMFDSIQFSINLFEEKEKSKALYAVSKNQITDYAEIISTELNKFLDGQKIFVNATVYNINRFDPLMMIKLSHEKQKKDILISDEDVNEELKKIDTSLWEKKATNIFFRKKLNYSIGNDIYIIRPNQRRFWSKSMALEDASELINEILTGVHDGN
ncbi:MAG TPA: N-6 DNA methylase [Bacteroidales bacterium]|nr:N-6 DNA methylase [Bacteroidales bacterium]